jgi:hypothetical protein
MSLVITSNISLDDKPDTSEVFKPYSYQNRLLNTMRIPANSEVALQSVKLNKNGLAIVDRANSQFNHYFGVPLGTTAAPDLSYSTQTPFPAVIGKGELFRAGGKAERSVEDLAKDIQSGINASAFNPILIQSSTPKDIVVSVEVDATSNSFKGFKYVASQNKLTTKRTGAVDGAVWTDVSMNKAKPPASQANGQVVGGVNGFHVVNKEYPLSQSNKDCVMSWGGMNTGDAQSPWVAGLTRINRETNYGGNVVERPQYFNPTTKLGIEAQNTIRLPRVQGQSAYCDVGIGRVGELLWVWQNGCASNTTTATQTIKYWGAHNANFATAYNLRTNDDGYDGVKYTLDNEHMSIYIGTIVDDDWFLLADFNVLITKGGTKGNLTAPICAPKMALYPVVGCSVGTGKTATMVELSAYANYPKWSSATYTNYDFWGYSQSSMLTQWCFDIEQRFWNRISVVTGGVGGDGLLIPILTVNAAGDVYYDSYESRIITAPSIEYGEAITANATASRLLGFLNDGVSDLISDVAGVQTTISTSVPILVGDVSLFIRLNNFTQNSVNARQGTLSKIVGHLPRFDNSGNETGGLYFEPHEKTYISLGNTDEILINSFDIDIVYDNETLCTALSGKTIVVFHIRKARV